MHTIEWDGVDNPYDLLEKKVKWGLEDYVDFAFSKDAPSNMFIPMYFLLEGTKFTEDDNFIKFDIEDQSYRTTRTMCNVFFFCYENFHTCVADTEFTDYVFDTLGSFSSIKYSFDLKLKKTPLSGQAKIMIGTLEALASLKSPDLQVAVIGSASAQGVVSGMSYDLLATQMTELGYYGAMLLIDPDEVPSSGFVGNFYVSRVRHKHNYKDKIVVPQYGGGSRDPTIIYDDVWLPSELSVSDIPDPRKVSMVPRKIALRDGSFKFVVHGGEKMTMTFNLVKHIDVPDNTNVMGGGLLFTSHSKHLLHAYGTSSNFGPYSREGVYNFLSVRFPSYDVQVDYPTTGLTRPLDLDYDLVRLHPLSRITMKYVDDHVPFNHRIVDQYYYKGKERRLFFNVPILSNPIIMVGDSCPSCIHFSRIMSSIANYSGVSINNILPAMLHSILGVSCVSYQGIQFMRLLALIKNHAKRSRTLNVMMADLNFVGYTEKTVARALRLLQAQKEISLQVVNLPRMESVFPRSKLLQNGMHDHKREVYYSHDGTYCQQVDDHWIYYDQQGKVDNTIHPRLLTPYNGKPSFKIQNLYVTNVPVVVNFIIEHLGKLLYCEVHKDLRRLARVPDYVLDPGGSESLFIGNVPTRETTYTLTIDLSIRERATFESNKTVIATYANMEIWVLKDVIIPEKVEIPNLDGDYRSGTGVKMKVIGTSFDLGKLSGYLFQFAHKLYMRTTLYGFIEDLPILYTGSELIVNFFSKLKFADINVIGTRFLLVS